MTVLQLTASEKEVYDNIMLDVELYMKEMTNKIIHYVKKEKWGALVAKEAWKPCSKDDSFVDSFVKELK